MSSNFVFQTLYSYTIWSDSIQVGYTLPFSPLNVVWKPAWLENLSRWLRVHALAVLHLHMRLEGTAGLPSIHIHILVQNQNSLRHEQRKNPGTVVSGSDIQSHWAQGKHEYKRYGWEEVGKTYVAGKGYLE